STATKSSLASSASTTRPSRNCAKPRSFRGLFMVTGLSHVSIAVPDLEAAARQLNDKYGLSVGARMVNAEQGVRLAYVELGAAKIELMEPSRPDSPIAKFLERIGRGASHPFALGVEVGGKPRHASPQRGGRMLGPAKPQPNVGGEPIAFIHPGDFLGALVELEEQKG